MELVGLLERERSAFLHEALEAMQRANLRHYQASGIEASRARLESLYDVMANCIATRSLMPMEDHAQAIAVERFRSGFGLGEVQTAFNVLEEAVWKGIETGVPAADLARSLALVSTVLGAGKDRLARAYVELATRTQLPTLDMQALFRVPGRS